MLVGLKEQDTIAQFIMDATEFMHDKEQNCGCGSAPKAGEVRMSAAFVEKTTE